MNASLACGALLTAVFMIASGVTAAQVAGAVFTTENACDGTNVNIFDSKDAVYLDGGPAHPGAAGLPDGEYYVQVTAPNGDLLGSSVGAADSTPVTVTDGEFALCYQLSAILIKASDGTPGYDDTPNNGGEYKVWVSQDPAFTSSETKTDNFKVKEDEEPCPPPCLPEPPRATLDVIKFYDANANGVNDDPTDITGWKIHIVDGIDLIRYTPVSIVVDPDDYTVTEFDTVETNWIHTTPNPVALSLPLNDPAGDVDAEFGNVCLGPGGGHTLGFWSNKNGERQMNDDGGAGTELAQLNALPLSNGTGPQGDFASYGAFRTWLLGAKATNMAYMLSAQLAAMVLNVEAGFVDGDALIYAPGTESANAQGFATVSDVIDEATSSLAANPYTPSGSSARADQEALKNALDAANNNKNFVQAEPCAFSFAGDA